MQYQAIKLNQKSVYSLGESVEISFIIQDEIGQILTDLSIFAFEGKLSSGSDGVTLLGESGDNYFSISGAKLTVNIPNADTLGLSDNVEYRLEIRAALNNKYYYLGQFEIWFKESLLD